MPKLAKRCEDNKNRIDATYTETFMDLVYWAWNYAAAVKNNKLYTARV